MATVGMIAGNALNVIARVRVLVPGLVLAGVIAVVATVVAPLVATAVSPVLYAVVIGLAIANLPATRSRLSSVRAGADFSTSRILRLGIILLGAQLSFAAISDVGVGAIAAVLGCLALALGAVYAFGSILSVPKHAMLLIAVGTAVCGNTAILATAPIVKARERDVSYAVATITLLGTVGLLAMPIIGRALGMTDAAFGIWAGLAINDTSQVVAAGAEYSPAALQVATVVKLFRNLMMAPILMVVAYLSVRAAAANAEQASGRLDPSVRRGIAKSLPLFVVGFAALAGLRSVGVLPEMFIDLAQTVSRACILVAIAAVGLKTRFATIRQAGVRPLAVGTVAFVLLAAVAYLVAARITS